MNFLFRIICKVGIFMVCAQAIIHFRPNKTYEKYLKLFVEIMVVVQIFSMSAGYFGKDSAKNFENKVKWFYEKLNEGFISGRGIEIMGEEQIIEEVEEIQEKMYQKELMEMQPQKEATEEKAKEENIKEVEIVEINVRINEAGDTGQ